MPLQFPKMVAGCHPGFDRTGNSAIRSADPENTILESNMKWIGSPVAEIWPFEIRHYTMSAFWAPILREKEVVRIVPSERTMLVSYTLPNVTIALSLTIRP